MKKLIWAAPVLALGALGLASCEDMASEGGITSEMLRAAGEDDANWITHGRT